MGYTSVRLFLVFYSITANFVSMVVQNCRIFSPAFSTSWVRVKLPKKFLLHLSSDLETNKDKIYRCSSSCAGPDNLDNLRKLAEQFQKQTPGAGEGTAAKTAQEDDDEVPELVAGETFEAAAAEEEPKS